MIKSPCEKGFTLIEMMVTMVVALVVLGGLMLNFTQQNSEYKYQGKRIDAVQDLEFTIKFVAEDLRSALISAGTPIALADAGADPFETTAISFFVWDETSAAANKREQRQYLYNPATKTLRYNRDVTGMTAAAAAAASSEILTNVTLFKIFNDSTARPAAYTGIPSAQAAIALANPAANTPGFTILIEVEVDAGYKNGSFVDVRSNNVGITGHKRIWRYMQIYPRTSVN